MLLVTSAFTYYSVNIDLVCSMLAFKMCVFESDRKYIIDYFEYLLDIRFFLNFNMNSKTIYMVRTTPNENFC